MKHLLLFALLCPSLCYSQRLLVDKYDKFNGWHEQQTSWKFIATNWSKALTVHAIRKGHQNSLEFKVGLSDVFRIDEGETAIILFTDEDQVRIKCSIGGIAYNKNGQWMCPATFALSETDLEKLKYKQIDAIRIPIGRNEYVDFELKDKHRNDIKDCLVLLK